MDWEHPYPTSNPVGRFLGQEGANLPNSITEDVVGLSLCPEYSEKQLRRMNRLRRAKHNNVHEDGNEIRRFVKGKSCNRYLSRKRIFSEEVTL